MQNYLTLTPQQLKDLKAIEALRAEQKEGSFSPLGIEKYTGVKQNTITKLKRKIELEAKEKDIKKLEAYINNYLFIKYFDNGAT